MTGLTTRLQKTGKWVGGFVALLAPLQASGVQAVDLPTKPILPMELAQKAAKAAIAQCRDDGYAASAVVVDEAGQVKVVLRADGAAAETVSSSTKKAMTAFSFGRPTGAMAQYVADNPQIHNLQFLSEYTLILQGGLPIIIDDQKVGGIGVGGAPGGHLDEACAQAGIDTITNSH